LQRDGNARVRNTVSEIDGAVDGIDDPAIFGGFVAGIAFLAEQGDFWESGVEFFLDQLLATDIEFELDVVRGDFVRLFLGVEILAHDRAGGSGGFYHRFLCCL